MPKFSEIAAGADADFDPATNTVVVTQPTAPGATTYRQRRYPASKLRGQTGATGATGPAGRGVTSITQSGGRFVVAYTDGTTSDAGAVPTGTGTSTGTGTTGTGGTTTTPPPATVTGGTTRQAKQADAFVDSVGVNTHNYGPYDTQYDAVVRPALRDLGIRHIRGYIGLWDDAYVARIKALRADHGIKLQYTVGPNDCPAADAAAFARDNYGTGAASAVSAIEGVNEADGYFATLPAAGSDWAVTTVNYQRDLWNASRDLGLPIVAATVINQPNASRISGCAPYCDWGNIHPYPGGRNPETKGWGGAGPNGPAGHTYASLEYNMHNLGYVVKPSAPMVVTETGYFNVLTVDQGVTEAVAGKYIPRLFLKYFETGILRTFSYELFNGGTDAANIEHNFGLLRADGSRKPAFTALMNLVAMLKDAGAAFTPGSLNYAVDNTGADVYSVLLQKRDGSFYLCLWLGTRIYNMDSHVNEPVTPRSVTLRVGGGPWNTVQIGRPNTAATWSTATGTASAGVSLTLDDQVTIVRLAA